MTHEEQKDYANAKYDVIKALDSIRKLKPEYQKQLAEELFGAELCASAWKIFKRDRLNHASPNSAQTEAVMAGALQVQLAGDAWYFGKKHEKPTIGDAVRPVEIEDIARANKLLYAASLLGMIVFCGIRIAVWFGIKMVL